MCLISFFSDTVGEVLSLALCTDEKLEAEKVYLNCLKVTEVISGRD